VRIGLLVVICCCALAASLRAEESPADPEIATRTRALKARAETWWTARKKMVGKCSQCGGQGKIRWHRGIHDCPKCDGRRRHMPADVYRRLNLEMKSPAFRLKEGAREKMEADYRTCLAGAWPPEIDKFKIEKVELVDKDHGLVYVVENADSVSRPQRWVWAEEKAKGDWWLYEAHADGPWPGGEGGPAPALAGAPLSPSDAKEVADALGGVRLIHELKGTAAWKRTLLMVFETKPDFPGGNTVGPVAADFRAAGKALWAGPSAWEALHWTFRAKFRDKFGAVEMKTYLVAMILRKDFDKIVWDNLTAEEQVKLFAPDWKQYEGWTIWRQE
jgi:hypothetical protein